MNSLTKRLFSFNKQKKETFIEEELGTDATVLEFGFKNLGNEGAGELAEALKVNQAWQEICLSGNHIGDEGAKKLAEALKVNQTLQKINLRENLIGGEGAAKLAEALKVNKILRRIDLTWNSIDNEGAGKLAEALKVNQTLQTIYLYGNSIDVNILRQIESILGDSERKKTLANKPSSQQSNFYSKLITMATAPQNIESHLQQVRQLIQDLHMTKFFYTAVSSMWRAGVLTKEMTSCHIVASLEITRELCTGADEIADYKLLLEKAESDGHIDRRQMFYLDNKAERNVVFNDQRFVSLMEAVKFNTARIEGLEANVEAINNSVNAIRKGLRHKMKVEAVMGLLSTAINAVPFGIGVVVQVAAASALGSIVDYGDIVHIQSVAANFGDTCVEQVKAGVDIAVNNYADKKLEEALMKGNVLTVVAAAAYTMHPMAATEPLDTENSTAVEFQEGLARVEKLETNKKDPDGHHIFDIAAQEDVVSTPTTHSARENQKTMKTGDPVSESSKSQVVERLLLTLLHGVDKKDIIRYSQCLIEEGFDTIDAIRSVLEDDLYFMKKGHKRVLLKKIGEENN